MQTVALSNASRHRMNKFLEAYASGKSYSPDDDDYFTFIDNKDLKNPIGSWGIGVRYVDSRSWDVFMTTKAVRAMILGWWIRYLLAGQVPVAFVLALSRAGIAIHQDRVPSRDRVGYVSSM